MMIPGTFQIPRPALPPDGTEAETASSADRAPLCAQCGAVATHYLTCASLRLPAGYRVAEDPEAPRNRLTSGPRHPDWPLPPRADPAPIPPPTS